MGVKAKVGLQCLDSRRGQLHVTSMNRVIGKEFGGYETICISGIVSAIPEWAENTQVKLSGFQGVSDTVFMCM